MGVGWRWWYECDDDVVGVVGVWYLEVFFWC